MANVSKKITSGASFGPTDAVANLDFAKEHGCMPCGNGDDHCLNADDMALIENHDSDEDLELPPGKLGRRLLVKFRVQS